MPAMTALHTLLVLDPGHFHAALTLGRAHPRVADAIAVYAPDGPERRDFLALVERFNGRARQPTRWRPAAVTTGDPLARLIEERRGDAVVLAGRNGGKARTLRRLHEAGFHVLADKPWLVDPGDLDDVRASLTGWPLAMEIMTGRHDAAARLLKRLVDAPDVFGAFADTAPAIALDSVHHLAKLVDGAPLRRPWWFFDVRVQGRGVVDIPTHQVDQTQWLLDGHGAAPATVPRLLAARVWPTRVPAALFRQITGEPRFPPDLGPAVQGDALDYACNAELEYRIGSVTARAAARWALSPPPGGGDTSHVAVHGTRSTLRLDRDAGTGYRRRLVVEAHDDRAGPALRERVASWQAELPGLGVSPAGPGRHEITGLAALDGGHETHFPFVLAAFLDAIDARRWPAARAARTLAKYTLLAEAAAATAAP
jgi:predicted dehydrogenase